MSTDQKIIALADEYIALADVYDAGWEAFPDIDSDDKEALARFSAEHDQQSDRMDEIEAAIKDMTPTTLPGFAAKAAVGMRVMRMHHEKDDELDSTFDIVASLCRALMAAAGR